MPFRTLHVDGAAWRVVPSGRVTQNDRDEFGLFFISGSGPTRVVRVTRYSPVTARFREASLAELTDDELSSLFRQSQPSDMSPEAAYSR